MAEENRWEDQSPKPEKWEEQLSPLDIKTLIELIDIGIRQQTISPGPLKEIKKKLLGMSGE